MCGKMQITTARRTPRVAGGSKGGQPGPKGGRPVVEEGRGGTEEGVEEGKNAFNGAKRG